MGRRLRKVDVERMLGDYDDDPVGTLTEALRIVFEAPTSTWDELLARATLTDERRVALVQRDPGALDALAAELNEVRTL